MSYTPGATGSTSVAGSSDVLLSNPTNTQLLQYDSTTQKWKNNTNTPTWNNVSSKPSTFTPSVHTHSISEVTNLQTQLDSRPTSSTISQIWTGTQASYDAIASKSSSTLYCVTG